MTAICYRDGVMAADRATTSEGVLIGAVDKIVRGPDGCLAAAAGSAYLCGKFNDWVQSGRRDPFQAEGYRREDLDVILVEASGAVKRYNGLGDCISDVADYYAEGFGYQLNLGAMAAGASAEEAVKIWVKLTGDYGSGVQVEHLAA